MFNYYALAFKRYADFRGGTTRPEFWWFFLVNVLIKSVLQFIGIPLLFLIYGLVVLIPEIAIWVRRLHDAGYSSWNMLWFLLPVIGWVILLILLCKPTKIRNNKYL